jgi:ubiquinone/menaquinone biosynthesis C-methylase UbiE
MRESLDLRSEVREEASLTRWERAYQAFETPEEEVQKFIQRLQQVGASGWSRESRVLEVCSGRGNGLRAWHALGFRNLVGVDLSPGLLKSQHVPGTRLLADARALPLRSRSFDVVIVQGGLHHLLTAHDVESALGEMCRVVRTTGRVIIIEPWLTPFLRFVHAVTEQPVARRFSQKIDAFETMREEERQTYEQWLNAPAEYLSIIHRYVSPEVERRQWGKLVIVGASKVS